MSAVKTQVIEKLKGEIAAIETGSKLKPAKVVVTEREAVMYQQFSYDQIKWWEAQAIEILEGTFDRKKKLFVTKDGRRFSIREAYWATEVF